MAGLTVAELRRRLRERGLQASGRKEELVARLREETSAPENSVRENSVPASSASKEEAAEGAAEPAGKAEAGEGARGGGAGGGTDEAAALAAYRARLLGQVDAMVAGGRGA